ncbi:MAG: transcription antitermination factor NusB [Deltaproteobacteria bacterium]|nr:transcription antitermination factor NusB [Deltaproteobacteria bacterium]
MSKRHLAREIALQILYGYDRQGITEPIELDEHFQYFRVPPDIQPFSSQLVTGTLQNIVQIDQILDRNLKKWKIQRLSTVDRCILRMAVYEMKYMPEIDVGITINEAVELAKQFGTEESYGFVNGILDEASRDKVD